MDLCFFALENATNISIEAFHSVNRRQAAFVKLLCPLRDASYQSKSAVRWTSRSVQLPGFLDTVICMVSTRIANASWLIS